MTTEWVDGWPDLAALASLPPGTTVQLAMTAEDGGYAAFVPCAVEFLRDSPEFAHGYVEEQLQRMFRLNDEPPGRKQWRIA